MYSELGDQVIKIEQQYLVNSIEELVEKVFPHIQKEYKDKYYVAHHAILTPKNQNVDRINAKVM